MEPLAQPYPGAGTGMLYSAPPSTGRADFMQDGHEVIRRQAEWEKEIESLDQKEMELHQSQLRLIREQTAIFIRDLAVLQQEVAVLKGAQASMPERISYVEKALGDSAEKHRRELEAAHGKLDVLHGHIADHAGFSKDREASLQKRVEYLEQLLGDSVTKHAKELQAARSAQERLERDVTKVHDEHHASVQERLSYIERAIGDSADKHEKHLREIKAAHSKADQLHERLADSTEGVKDLHATLQNRLESVERFVRDALDKHSRDMDQHKASHAKLVNDAKVRDSSHSTVAQRLEFLERMCGDSVDKHAKELDLARNKLDQLHGRLNEHHSQLMHHSSLQERVAYVEKTVGDSIDKHNEELASAHAKLDHMRGRVSSCEAHGSSIDNLKKAHASMAGDKAKLDAHHSSQAERLDYLEKVVAELAQSKDRESSDHKAKLDQLHGRMTACEKQGLQIDGLQKSHTGLLTEKAASDHHHATLKERVDYLEGLCGSSADKHYKEVEALKSAHARISAESKQRDTHHATMAERLSFIEQMLGDSADKHSQELLAAHSKLDQLHSRLATCESHGSAIESLKKSHASLSSDRVSLETHHASMQERVEYLERLAGDSADKHQRELAAAHAKIDQLHGRVSGCERHGHTLEDLKKAHAGFASGKASQEVAHDVIREKLEAVEKKLADHGDKHAKEIDNLKNSHNRLASDHKAHELKHGSVQSRMEQMESALVGHADKHAKELAAAHAKHDQLHGRLSEDRAALESHVRSLVGNEKEMRDSHHATLKERVDYVESLLGESYDKHGRELETLRSAHAKAGKDQKARDSHHATLVERLEKLERWSADSHGKHAQELASAHSKLDQVHNRLTTCEKSGSTLDEFHKAHSGIAGDKVAALDRNHATLREKVEYLEGLVGDSVEKHHAHMKEAENLRAGHAKMTSEAKQRDVKHASMEERLKYLEKLLDDSADRHSSQFNAAASKFDEVHSRLVQCEAHGTAIESLKKGHANLNSEHVSRTAHHAKVSERLDFLERLVGDSADRHSKEIAAAHARLDQLHGRVTDEQAQRESHGTSFEREKDTRTHHASIQKRLDSLESLISASATKYEQLDQKVVSITQLLDQNMANISEYLQGEKTAREVHEREVKSHLTREKSSREVHEALVADQFSHEKGARERHAETVQEALVREREERGKHHASIHEEMHRRSTQHEANHKELYDLVHKTRSMTDQQHSTYAENLHRERNHKATLEEMLAQEKAERGRHHDTVNERVDSLQRTVNIFDGLIRKEMDERSKENRRIWDAIDNHTHDLSTQVITEAGYSNADQPISSLTMGAGTGGSGIEVPPPRLLKPMPTTGAASAPISPYSRCSSMPQPLMEPAVPVTVTVPSPMPMVAAPVTTTVRAMTPTPLRTAFSAPGPGLGGLGLPVGQGHVSQGGFGSSFGQRPRSAGPASGSPSSASPAGREHHLERVTCGHTRYGGERHRSAEMHVD